MYIGTQLKPGPLKGYRKVTLTRNGKTHCLLVHRIVLEAFVGPCPPNKRCAHDNEVRSDNRLENISWKALGCTGKVSREQKRQAWANAPSPFDSTVDYRDVPGFPGYRVGSDGSVWTSRRMAGLKWVKKTPDTLHNGYLRVAFQNGEKRRRVLVHCLVLELFVGPRPDGMEACHYPDPDKSNCRLNNLRWDTSKENSADTVRLGRQKIRRGSLIGTSKLTEADAIEILRLHSSGMRGAVIARRKGMSKTQVSRIIRGKSWAHVRLLTSAVPKASERRGFEAVQQKAMF